MTLEILLVANRLFVRFTRRRHSHNHPLSISDYLVLLALLFNITQLSTYMPFYVRGQLHESFFETEESDNYRHLYYVMDVIYFIPMYLLKLAMLLFFLEITPSAASMSKIRWAIYVGLLLSFTGLCLTELHYTTRCGRHIELNWDPELNNTCNKRTQGKVAISGHFVTDLYS